MKKIIPAILTNDLDDLKNKFAQLEGLVDWIQIDIMDNVFVPNCSIQVADLAEVNHPFNLEAHLMVENPEDYFADCQAVGFKRVIFHLEATRDAAGTLAEMSKYDFSKGMALNPETPIEHVLPYLKDIDLVLFLTVHPGFQGQQFIPEVLPKVKQLKAANKSIIIEIDGGLNINNIKQAAVSGADYLAVGSGVFKHGAVAQNLQQLKVAVAEM